MSTGATLLGNLATTVIRMTPLVMGIWVGSWVLLMLVLMLVLVQVLSRSSLKLGIDTVLMSVLHVHAESRRLLSRVRSNNAVNRGRG